jgi:hypothetical protein
VFDEEITAFLESGCSLIVGTVAADGEPHAGRAWGLSVTHAEDQPSLRVLLDVDDVTTVEHAAAGGAIAITATSVRTLRSVQLKGRTLGLEVATHDDGERAQRYIDEFFTDIRETDGTDIDVIGRLVPAGYVACTVEVHDRFNQTPGPGAGAPIGTSTA